MAGHSKFKNIMHRKGAQDRSRAKLFARLVREISVAVKIGGSDINSNPRLKTAISSAKADNMPKDNIERAIKKAEGNDPDSNYEEVRYEGYGPSKIAFIIEAATNNRNRTASEIRTIFSKGGGEITENGTVSYDFKKLGNIKVLRNNIDEEKFFDFVIENGSIELETENEFFSVYCELANYNNLLKKISDNFISPNFKQIMWKSNSEIEPKNEDIEKIFKLIDDLENHEDVQSVSSNLFLSEKLTQKILNEKGI